MRDHIQTVVGRYKGRIQSWDVVNEALNEDGTLRQSPWLKIIGEDYIAKAFQYAHEADPQAPLTYNDYNLENEAKRKGALALIAKLKAQGVPVTSVGLQGHDTFTWPALEDEDATISAFAKLGVKVAITELDIDVLPRHSEMFGAEVSLKFRQDPKAEPLHQRIAALRATGTREAICRPIQRLSEASRCGLPGDVLGRDGWGFMAEQLAGEGAHQLSAAIRSRRRAEAGLPGSRSGSGRGQTIGSLISAIMRDGGEQSLSAIADHHRTGRTNAAPGTLPGNVVVDIRHDQQAACHSALSSGFRVCSGAHTRFSPSNPATRSTIRRCRWRRGSTTCFR